MGDRDVEFSGYFAARAAALRRVAYALCGDWHAAEDLVQVTFLRLYRNWRRLRGETVDGYARRVLVNAFLSDRVRQRREVVLANVPEPAVRAPDAAATVDVRRALAALPPRQRAVVV